MPKNYWFQSIQKSYFTVMDLNGSKNEAEILQIAMQSDEVQNI
jgi:hypothetical protein